MNRSTVGAALAGAALAAAVVSCASTEVLYQWRKEGYAGPALKKVLVVGIAKQEGLRRSFEDGFAVQLRALGVEGVRAYTLAPESGPVDKDKMATAVRASGADGVLVVRFVKVDNRVQVTPGLDEGPPDVRELYGYYGWCWAGCYAPPVVYTYELIDMEIKLFEAQGAELVWSLATESLYPSDIHKGIAAFAKTVLAKARKHGLL